MKGAMVSAQQEGVSGTGALYSRFVGPLLASDEGADAVGGTPEQFAALIRDEIPRWGRVVRESGARVD